MPDKLTKSERSRLMSRVQSYGNKTTEIAFRHLLRRCGIKGWRRHVDLPGKPDFTFRESRLAVFVDGCFWHSCPLHASHPESNAAFWRQKFARNRRRDAKVNHELRKLGWVVLRFWEHEMLQPDMVLRRLKRALGARSPRSELLPVARQRTVRNRGLAGNNRGHGAGRHACSHHSRKPPRFL